MTHKTRPMTIDDLWALKRIGAPTLSPDGRFACVAITSYDMKDNESTSQLWIVSTDGRTQRQLTRGRHDSDPQWSPDGRLIAFVSRKRAPEKTDEPQPARIYVIGADGGEAECVSRLATGAESLRWFPDSRRIAFISWVWPGEKSEKAQGERVGREHKNKVKAVVTERNQYRYWDHWFLRDRRAHLFALDTGTHKATDLFAGTPFFLPYIEPDANSYDIAPDGREIAFVHDFDPDPVAPTFTDIVLLDLATRTWRIPTEDSGRHDENPRYSPDGRHIAYLSSDLKRSHNDMARLAVIDRKSGARRPLTQRWDRAVNPAHVWSADSKSIYFTAEDDIRCPVWRVPAKGGTPVETHRGPGHGGTTGPIAMSPEGTTLVYLRSSLEHPPRLFADDANGGNERAIESFNDARMAKIAIGTSESVRIKGAEGDMVQMTVIKPSHFDAKKRWPLMHSIHGGPHTCFGDNWHWRWNSQLFAAHGYVVAQVNYHGSTGWGQKFICSIDRDWGPREMADVEAGTDYLLKSGYIDPERIVATGGSYGGYMVAYMNGNVKKPRYQAYVCHAGCYDWVAMMASDACFWFNRELGAYPWEDEARVLKQSPHHYAQNFVTPTLVIHGALDYRVPYQQGLAYYNTLRVKKVPSRLVYFPDENHWILKPQNSRLWYEEFFGWCERWAGTAADRKRHAKRASKAGAGKAARGRTV